MSIYEIIGCRWVKIKPLFDYQISQLTFVLLLPTCLIAEESFYISNDDPNVILNITEIKTEKLPEFAKYHCCTRDGKMAFAIETDCWWSLSLTEPNASWCQHGPISWSGATNLVGGWRIAVSEDSSLIAIATMDGRIVVLDMKSGGVQSKTRLPFVIVESKSKIVDSAHAALTEVLRELMHAGISSLVINTISFNEDASRLVVFNHDNSLLELDSNTLQIVRVLAPSTRQWKAVAVDLLFESSSEREIHPQDTLYSDLSKMDEVLLTSTADKQEDAGLISLVCSREDGTIDLLQRQDGVRAFSKTNGTMLWECNGLNLAATFQENVFGIKELDQEKYVLRINTRTGKELNRWRISTGYSDFALQVPLDLQWDDSRNGWFMLTACQGEIFVGILTNSTSKVELSSYTVCRSEDDSVNHVSFLKNGTVYARTSQGFSILQLSKSSKK